MELKTLYPKSKKAALVFRALNNKLRQQIIQFILENPATTVTTIYRKLRLEQSVASQHLAILRKEGIVKTERDGKFIYYSVDERRLATIESLADQLCSR